MVEADENSQFSLPYLLILASLAAIPALLLAYVAAQHNPQHVYLSPAGLPTTQYLQLIAVYLIPFEALAVTIWLLTGLAGWRHSDDHSSPD